VEVVMVKNLLKISSVALILAVPQVFGEEDAIVEPDNYYSEVQTLREENETMEPDNYYSKPDGCDNYAAKTVHVKGYRRKNGTWVRPHTRRRPSRR
jgi:hypothetical protein